MKTDREKLIDFHNWMGELDREKIMSMEEHPVDVYLESINKALDETKTVNNNEQTREVCEECGDEFTPLDKWNFHCQSCQPCKAITN